jgi:hypothetical protein
MQQDALKKELIRIGEDPSFSVQAMEDFIIFRELDSSPYFAPLDIFVDELKKQPDSKPAGDCLCDALQKTMDRHNKKKTDVSRINWYIKREAKWADSL